jgi:hypothetical protein
MDASIPLYDALISINVPPDKARIVVQALEKDTALMTANLATKHDVEQARTALKSDLALLESRMTVKLGAMLFAAVGIVVTLIKVL